MKILFVGALAAGMVVIMVLVGMWIFSTRSITLGRLENIHGIPFPVIANEVHITEKLAHADIFPSSPILAKQLRLTLTFRPKTTDRLYVGVRENAFWLSYSWQLVFDRTGQPTTNQPTKPDAILTQTITIPLTDKLSDRDGSLDLMFLAGAPEQVIPPDEGINDATDWQVVDWQADIAIVQPSLAEIRNYLVSRLKRERPM